MDNVPFAGVRTTRNEKTLAGRVFVSWGQWTQSPLRGFEPLNKKTSLSEGSKLGAMDTVPPAGVRTTQYKDPSHRGVMAGGNGQRPLWGFEPLLTDPEFREELCMASTA
jgi:hypothetical protein